MLFSLHREGHKFEIIAIRIERHLLSVLAARFRAFIGNVAPNMRDILHHMAPATWQPTGLELGTLMPQAARLYYAKA